MTKSYSYKKDVFIFDISYYWNDDTFFNEFHIKSGGWHLFYFNGDGLFISYGVSEKTYPGIELDKYRLLVKDESDVV